MLKEIEIGIETPRKLGKGLPSLKKGLELNLFFGVFFTFGGLTLFLISVVVFQMIFPSIFILLIGSFGFLVLRKAILNLRIRKELLLNGNIIPAKVIKHGRRFNLFKSNKDYVVTVICNKTKVQVELVSGKNSILNQLPINSQIKGLQKGANYFFLEEIGCKLI